MICNKKLTKFPFVVKKIEIARSLSVTERTLTFYFLYFLEIRSQILGYQIKYSGPPPQLYNRPLLGHSTSSYQFAPFLPSTLGNMTTAVAIPIAPEEWRNALEDLPEGGNIPAFYFAHGRMFSLVH